jgi:hypothetical protein
VAAAAPGTAARAKALLFAAGRLAAFAERVGLELDAGVLFQRTARTPLTRGRSRRKRGTTSRAKSSSSRGLTTCRLTSARS